MSQFLQFYSFIHELRNAKMFSQNIKYQQSKIKKILYIPWEIKNFSVLNNYYTRPYYKDMYFSFF